MSRRIGDAADPLTPASGWPDAARIHVAYHADRAGPWKPTPRTVPAQRPTASRLESAHRELLAETDVPRPPVPEGRAPRRDRGVRRRRPQRRRRSPRRRRVRRERRRRARSRGRASTRRREASPSRRSPRRVTSRSRLPASTSHRMACSSPLLIELPPLVACEIQLRLLVLLDVASEVSLWRADDGDHRAACCRSARAPRAGARARRPRARSGAAAA